MFPTKHPRNGIPTVRRGTFTDIENFWKTCDVCDLTEGEQSIPINLCITCSYFQRLYFLEELDQLALNIQDCIKRHGFYDPQRVSLPESIALMHSELSELLEANRHGNPPSEHIPEFSAEEEEIADLIIRTLDECAYRGYRISAAIKAKMLYNETRPIRHGKKY